MTNMLKDEICLILNNSRFITKEGDLNAAKRSLGIILLTSVDVTSVRPSGRGALSVASACACAAPPGTLGRRLGEPYRRAKRTQRHAATPPAGLQNTHAMPEIETTK